MHRQQNIKPFNCYDNRNEPVVLYAKAIASHWKHLPYYKTVCDSAFSPCALHILTLRQEFVQNIGISATNGMLA
jgi:hypothetical protein